MPTYAYLCQHCRHEFDAFQSITAGCLRKCPQCGKARLKRLIGTGSGIIFKGSGFYATDYRSDGYKTAAQKETGGAKAATADKKEAKMEVATPSATAQSESSAGEKKKSA
jgi:putative FmdB family regulatory protein